LDLNGVVVCIFLLKARLRLNLPGEEQVKWRAGEDKVRDELLVNGLCQRNV
jgi:hypothetical protein